ncbi:hypothetical protein T265_02582 [Opisthorchis viverrini]|uniref:Uncharacterized protein n=1 Tax=Opisthorchis viverrini TaxID=6198 RepID=A0A074ZYT1_OPIVI|nr:hypothetical protein T265_02582 [Opisthorchis viverrini]KER31137.1 hypothetical protein T265_02582 [Opisthorchis viverrini]
MKALRQPVSIRANASPRTKQPPKLRRTTEILASRRNRKTRLKHLVPPCTVLVAGISTLYTTSRSILAKSMQGLGKNSGALPTVARKQISKRHDSPFEQHPQWDRNHMEWSTAISTPPFDSLRMKG